jgi:hypothetical protein
MYDNYTIDPGRFQTGSSVRGFMKKWVALLFILLVLSGCSLQKVKKWLDGLEWERSDRTIRVIDLFMR